MVALTSKQVLYFRNRSAQSSDEVLPRKYSALESVSIVFIYVPGKELHTLAIPLQKASVIFPV